MEEIYENEEVEQTVYIPSKSLRFLIFKGITSEDALTETYYCGSSQVLSAAMDNCKRDKECKSWVVYDTEEEEVAAEG